MIIIGYIFGVLIASILFLAGWFAGRHWEREQETWRLCFCMMSRLIEKSKTDTEKPNV